MALYSRLINIYLKGTNFCVHEFLRVTVTFRNILPALIFADFVVTFSFQEFTGLKFHGFRGSLFYLKFGGLYFGESRSKA